MDRQSSPLPPSPPRLKPSRIKLGALSLLIRLGFMALDKGFYNLYQKYVLDWAKVVIGV